MKILKKQTYIQMIKNSIGTKMFKSLYIEKNGNQIDILENGNLSCAYFVSSVLYMFDLINSVHATVKSTVNDMKNSGWKIYEDDKNKIPIGAVIVWEEMQYDKNIHSHIGFYIGNKKAISNSSNEKGVIIEHDYKYNGKRNIKQILINQILKLD